MEDLSIGHEVEFSYQYTRYTISQNDEGWYLTTVGQDEYQSFIDQEELVSNAVINSCKLQEIWKYIEDVSVF